MTYLTEREFWRWIYHFSVNSFSELVKLGVAGKRRPKDVHCSEVRRWTKKWREEEIYWHLQPNAALV